MKRSRLLLVALLTILLVVALAACARNGEDEEVVTPPQDEQVTNDPGDTNEEENDDGDHATLEIGGLEVVDEAHPLAALHAIQERFPVMSGGRSSGTPQYGGAIVHGFPHVDPAPGVFNAVFQMSLIDSNLMMYTGVIGNIFSMTPSMMMGQHGIATYEVDRDNQRIIITQVEDVYWHDGHPLTLDDLLFAHEVIGDPEYIAAGGGRFGINQRRITGMMDFHNGDANYISGMILSDDQRTLTIYFDEFPPTLLYFGIWGTPYPRHIFGDVPIDEHTEHYHTRVRPIGWGPFIVENIVPGESVYAVANENFWMGRPYLDSVVTRIVSPDMVASMMLNGDLDVVGWRLEDYPDVPNPTNFMYLGDVGNFFNWVAFNMGDWNPETLDFDLHENPRMSRPLRRAMAYASNESLLTDGLFNGLRFPATTFIPPGHSTFMHPTLPGFAFDPDLAMEILDEAGYTVGADGYRTFPDGSELEIHFVISGGGDASQVAVATHYAQAWGDIGLNVYIEWVDWTAKVTNIFEADNWEWDVTTAAWSAGANPDPNGLWGRTPNNRARYMNPTLSAHLEGFGSEDAWDVEWLTNHFHIWQEMMFYYVPAFPTNWRLSLTAVNNRVEGYFIGQTEDGIRTIGGAHRVRVTADAPYRQ
ncbi:MAG: ABC transporter substrate-binding protein [Defluviitaleaceae bacterium]|nr:ABC transporter substrate-binding protein [Defluviitaleaceae bacterium]